MNTTMRLYSAIAFGSIMNATLLTAQPGLLDPTFGVNGMVTTNFLGAANSFVQDMVVQPDGKIVAVGHAALKGAMARYLPNGELDPAFSLDGKLTTTIAGHYWTKWSAVALQPDGKLVVVGHVFDNPGYDQAMARFLPDGTLDPDFGSGGIFVYDHSGSTYEECVDVAVQPDGKILVLSVWNSEEGKDVTYVARLRPNGTFDNSFGNSFGNPGRVVLYSTGVSDEYIRPGAMLLEEDGRILIGVARGPSDALRFCVLALDEDGYDHLVGNMSYDGIGIDYQFATAFCRSLIRQPDGKYVIAGHARTGNQWYSTLGRFTSDGYIDETFGFIGTRAMSDGGSLQSSSNVICSYDGRLFVTGYAGPTLDSLQFALRRLDTEGFDDPYFGGGSTVFLAPTVNSGGMCCALDATGRYIVGGWSDPNSDVFTLLGVGSGINIGSVEQPTGDHATLWPNPVIDDCRISGLQMQPTDRYTISDPLGRIVSQGMMRTDVLSMRSMDPGWYHLRIEDSDGQLKWSESFIKQAPTP
jgi:uncharacterized delta-60 repeat protein